MTEEILYTFQDVEQIRSRQRLYKCHYLRACIDEAMRLAPEVPGLLPRQVLPGGVSVQGEYFPAGTILGVPCYALHHQETYFPGAFSYEPGRWIESDCNTVESSITVARMLWLFQLRLAEGPTRPHK